METSIRLQLSMLSVCGKVQANDISIGHVTFAARESFPFGAGKKSSKIKCVAVEGGHRRGFARLLTGHGAPGRRNRTISVSGNCRNL